MEFEKKTWVGGDTVTAAHLNRIENGIDDLTEEVEAAKTMGGGVLIVHCTVTEQEEEITL